MVHDINLGGTIYISSKRAAEVSGYKQDYIGQLARSGAIEAKRVSGLWYILEDSLMRHKEKAEEYKPAVHKQKENDDHEVSVSFDGKDYISASRASKISTYNSDYITQLARSGTILARQVGNRWYVDRESLLSHKKEKDALLAGVQRDAVGIAEKREPGAFEPVIDEKTTHFSYVYGDNQTFFPIEKKESHIGSESSPPHNQDELAETEKSIPIRIIEPKNLSNSVKRASFLGRMYFFLPYLFPALILGAIFVILNLYFSENNQNVKVLQVKLPGLIENAQGILSKEIFYTRKNDF